MTQVVGQRDVKSVLYFRNDISPFLVHLTRDVDELGTLAKDNLKNILSSHKLVYGPKGISHASFGFDYDELTEEIERKYFSAISFTDTPLNEIHNLLDIKGRGVELQPYGLVFLKDKIREKGVSPVIYINNFRGDKDTLIRSLCEMIKTSPDVAQQILPYIAVFGETLSPMGRTSQRKSIDFTWEREWRYASPDGTFEFEKTDIFVGLCPHDEIRDFEEEYGLLFVDPQRNTKWYAEKLVTARQEAKLKYSVV